MGLLVKKRMRKYMIAGVVALVILSAGVMVMRIKRHLQRSAIIAALQSRQESRQKCVVMMKTGYAQHTTIFREAEYLSALKRISTDGCPESFREAWLEYVQAWERMVAPGDIEKRQDILTMAAVKGKVEGNGDLGIGLGGGLKLAGGVSVEADLSNLKDMAKRLESRDTNEAFRHVEVVSLSYGVDALKCE
jgi:hypothetical protein